MFERKLTQNGGIRPQNDITRKVVREDYQMKKNTPWHLELMLAKVSNWSMIQGSGINNMLSVVIISLFVFNKSLVQGLLQQEYWDPVQH